MRSPFVWVGNVCLNLELITHVESHGPTQSGPLLVRFTSGSSLQLKDQEARMLREALKSFPAR